MKTILINVFIYLTILLSIAACNSQTEVREKIISAELPNGFLIQVKKIDTYTSQIGVVSGHVYGKSHAYSYQFTLSPGRIYWYGGSSVPQEIILCSNEIYIHYLQLDSQGNSGEASKIIKSHYDKHIDNRYFFKLLGDQYWVTDSALTYKNSNNCKKSDIPNDRELTRT